MISLSLLNLQVNFSYHEAGEHKQALVKLVTCERYTSHSLYSMFITYIVYMLLYTTCLVSVKLDNPLFYFFNVTRCAEKLYYKRRKDAERSESKEKKKQKRKRY